MFKQIIKGSPDYLNKKKIRTTIITIIYFLISLGIILAGYLTTGTKKNLLTVVGILGCLPACKSAVSMIMLYTAKGCSDSAKERLAFFNERLILMYDMYFTSLNINYSISNMLVEDGVIIAFTEDKNFKQQEFKEHITTMLKQASCHIKSITVVDDIDKYIDMLNNLVSANENINKENDDKIRISLYEISL